MRPSQSRLTPCRLSHGGSQGCFLTEGFNLPPPLGEVPPQGAERANKLSTKPGENVERKQSLHVLVPSGTLEEKSLPLGEGAPEGGGRGESRRALLVFVEGAQMSAPFPSSVMAAPCHLPYPFCPCGTFPLDKGNRPPKGEPRRPFRLCAAPLASHSGGGAQCVHWAERAAPIITPKSRPCRRRRPFWRSGPDSRF